MPRSNPLLKCHPEARKRDRVQNIQRTAAMQFFLYMEGESLPLVRTSLLSTPSSGCSKPCKRESQPCLYGYDRASWVSANAAFAQNRKKNYRWDKVICFYTIMLCRWIGCALIQVFFEILVKMLHQLFVAHFGTLHKVIFVKFVKPKRNFSIALGIVTPWGEDLRQSCVAVYWSKAPFYEVGRERCEPGSP